jgi:hypothetical protein
MIAIHGPVPGYAARLEKSLDRFFATLPFGKIISRSNWSISMDGKLSKPGNGDISIRKQGNDGCQQMEAPHRAKMTPATYEPTQAELDDWREQAKKIDPVNCCLRMERQTLYGPEKRALSSLRSRRLLSPYRS